MVIEFSCKNKVTKKGGLLQMEPALIFSDPQNSFIGQQYFSYVLKATYYLGNWNFSGIYCSPEGYPDGCMVGTCMKTKSYYRVAAGWSNSSWNLQLQIANFARWNWRSNKGIMHSQYYDRTEQTYTINDHALARLSVTPSVSVKRLNVAMKRLSNLVLIQVF